MNLCHIECRRAFEELTVAHRLFQRYEHHDPARLVEFLFGEWRRVLGPERAYQLSQRARARASRLEAEGAALNHEMQEVTP